MDKIQELEKTHPYYIILKSKYDILLERSKHTKPINFWIEQKQILLVKYNYSIEAEFWYVSYKLDEELELQRKLLNTIPPIEDLIDFYKRHLDN